MNKYEIKKESENIYNITPNFNNVHSIRSNTSVVFDFSFENINLFVPSKEQINVTQDNFLLTLGRFYQTNEHRFVFIKKKNFKKLSSFY